MANTTFNTRIKLKYDTLANWTSSNPTLLKGEIAVVEVPNAVDPIRNAPSILMKAGDGTSDFNTLKYLSGLAGDVYAWAKAAEKPAYTANEISGLDTYISGQIQDTDTQYKIDFADGKVRLFSKALGDENFGTTAVAEATIPAYTLATGSANGTVAFNDTDVAVKGLGSAAFVETTAFDAAGTGASEAATVKTAIETKIGTVPEGKTVASMIADAQTAATYDDSALAGRVSAIEGNYLKGADKTALENALNDEKDAAKTGSLAAQIKTEKERMDAFLLDADVSENAVDTLKEIQAYITSDGSAASEITTKIGALETAVGKNGDSLVPVSTSISNAIDALDLANTYDAKGTATTAETNAKLYADGLADNYDAAGAADTAKTEAIAAAKTAADAAYVAKETGKGLSANDFTDALKTKVEGIEEGAQVNVIESIEVNGVAATVANKKATVAVSLDQINANTAENYVIFDCGSASTLV